MLYAGISKASSSPPNYCCCFSVITRILEELSQSSPQARVPPGGARALRVPRGAGLGSSGQSSPQPSPRPGPARPVPLRAPHPAAPGRARASRPLPASIPAARLGRYLGNASFRPRLSQSRSGGGRAGPAHRKSSQWESAGGGGAAPAAASPRGRAPEARAWRRPAGGRGGSARQRRPSGL